MNSMTKKLQFRGSVGIQSKWALQAAVVVFGSLLIAVSAKIALPLLPVPITLQTVAILFLAMLFGSRLAVTAVLLYFAEAMAGLPVLSGPIAGPAVFMGPTMGYLLGFIVAAAFTGYMAEKGHCRTWVKAFLTALFASLLILIAGGIALSFELGPKVAIEAGVLPFIFGDLLKAIFLAIVVPALYAREQKN